MSDGWLNPIRSVAAGGTCCTWYPRDSESEREEEKSSDGFGAAGQGLSSTGVFATKRARHATYSLQLQPAIWLPCAGVRLGYTQL